MGIEMIQLCNILSFTLAEMQSKLQCTRWFHWCLKYSRRIKNFCALANCCNCDRIWKWISYQKPAKLYVFVWLNFSRRCILSVGHLIHFLPPEPCAEVVHGVLPHWHLASYRVPSLTSVRCLAQLAAATGALAMCICSTRKGWTLSSRCPAGQCFSPPIWRCGVKYHRNDNSYYCNVMFAELGQPVSRNSTSTSTRRWYSTVKFGNGRKKMHLTSLSLFRLVPVMYVPSCFHCSQQLHITKSANIKTIIKSQSVCIYSRLRI